MTEKVGFKELVADAEQRIEIISAETALVESTSDDVDCSIKC